MSRQFDATLLTSSDLDIICPIWQAKSGSIVTPNLRAALNDPSFVTYCHGEGRHFPVEDTVYYLEQELRHIRQKAAKLRVNHECKVAGTIIGNDGVTRQAFWKYSPQTKLRRTDVELFHLAHAGQFVEMLQFYEYNFAEYRWLAEVYPPAIGQDLKAERAQRLAETLSSAEIEEKACESKFLWCL